MWPAFFSIGDLGLARYFEHARYRLVQLPGDVGLRGCGLTPWDVPLVLKIQKVFSRDSRTPNYNPYSGRGSIPIHTLL